MTIETAHNTTPDSSVNRYSTSLLHDGPTFNKPLVDTLEPIQFKLKNNETIATAFPIFHHSFIPEQLLSLMHEQFNAEIERGDTYPQLELLSREEFIDYWCHSMCVILLETDNLNILQNDIAVTIKDWNRLFLGTFYIKPNYMPRCSHNCNAGFLVNSSHRGKKIGYRLAQTYLKLAPLLGYTYSVYNLVFVTNIASWKIWDHFKFDRIGLVPNVAVIKGYKDPVDAIIFGKDLTTIEPELFDDFNLI
ncbi:N-acetyltransferase Mpr1p [Monosporozyma unispora]|nr:histidine-containing response regulator phosphotransferase Mpr1 [Kazachstania unispora]